MHRGRPPWSPVLTVNDSTNSAYASRRNLFFSILNPHLLSTDHMHAGITAMKAFYFTTLQTTLLLLS